MTTINWSIIGSGIYNTILYPFIVNVETVQRNVDLTPVDDGKGYLTMGAGLNLTASNVRSAVLDKILYPDGNTSLAGSSVEIGYRSQLSNAIANHDAARLDTIMAGRETYWAAHQNVDHPSSTRTSFSFANAFEAQEVFLDIKQTYEDKVDSKFLSTVQFSPERVALFSLAYNTKEGVSNLLGSHLITAIDNGNRAEAWYEIRYQSNGDQLTGIAKRRYYESQEFSLYDRNHAVDDAEARQIYQMITRHWDDKISPYDTTYGAQVVNATTDYNTTVQTTTQALAPPCNSCWNTTRMAPILITFGWTIKMLTALDLKLTS